MPMNLSGMGGAAGNGQAMETLFDQRMRAAALQQQDAQFKARLAQEDALTRLKAQEMADATASRLELGKQAQADRAEAAKHLNMARIDAQLKEIPTDQPISQPTVAGMTDAGIVPERFKPVGIDNMPAPPASIAAPGEAAPMPQPGRMGPNNPEDAVPMPGTIANSPMPGRVNFTRIPTAQELTHQQDVEQRNAPRPVMRVGRNGTMEQIGEAPAGSHIANEPAPPHEPTAHFTAQDRYQDGKPVAGTLNTLTGAWTPHPEQGSLHAPAKDPNAAHAESKKEALSSLDQLDQAIDAAADFIGPGAGRVSSIQQMVGNQDPKLNALGTKMLLAKMQVDHAATGTVRAGASPTILARWDNILGNNVTPAALKASVQAMREILGGGTAGGTIKMVAPDGRKLNVPAAKVAELEAAGAKRVP